MSKAKALVLRAAGTNCDRESQYALEQAGFSVERIHVFRIMENPAILDEFQFLLLPGGFSYGDDIASGKILANQMLHKLSDPLNKFVDNGKLVLGICNGFQVLIKSGLLPGGKCDPQEAHKQATLAWNDCGMFHCSWVNLRADSDKCVFLPKGEVLKLPVAHAEGKFVPLNQDVLTELGQNDQLALRYCDAQGNSEADNINPNGSVDNIAGICDPTGRVMGLMPHPERFIEVENHPKWTREDIKRADGRLFFENAFEYLK